ncbi:acyltransferase family protein [Paramicrobacterium agarici]|uniref:Peptidoglycan/LPS O-acetylase OafA/YrhL n=1 Tax=Paramicrobacterium agarici TaxID=630514 RepID=A0A2A9E130_9MICO|nr:acyltransferase [Microbacterium agarici]PFG31880.1 peptidoglycan/LPS O-acetylase OafA/YrhL [Microbacterium agarici]
MSSPTVTRPRFALIDLTRFAAAAAVLIYHFTARENKAWGEPVNEVFPGLFPFAKYGFLGVEVFFIISGFVILLSAEGRKPAAFIASRVSRVYPAYWTGVALTSFLLLFLWPAGKDISVAQALLNLTLLQEVFNVPHIDGVYWTLWAELRFYLLVFGLIIVGLTRERVLSLAILWPPLAALFQQLDSDVIDTILMPEQAPLFSMGIIIYLLVKQPKNFVLWAALGVNWIFAVFQTNGGTRIGAESNTENLLDPVIVAVVLGFAGVAICLFALTRLSRIRAAWMTSLGLLTYPLYLVHEHWGWWMLSNLREAPSWLALLIASLGCIALAWAIYAFVEKPFGPRMRALLKRHLSDLGATREHNFRESA